jgi:hypothetical protein
MKQLSVLLFLAFTLNNFAQQRIESLPEWNENGSVGFKQDWLISKSNAHAEIYRAANKKDIILFNGLLKRVFRLQPNLACTDFINVINGQQLLRAVKPEARIIIDGKEIEVSVFIPFKFKMKRRPEDL